MISPWERERANGTETRIISSFIDCGIGCFPFRTGSTGNYYLLFTYSSARFVSFISPFGRFLEGALVMGVAQRIFLSHSSFRKTILVYSILSCVSWD
jgi:hypothetical protein